MPSCQSAQRSDGLTRGAVMQLARSGLFLAAWASKGVGFSNSQAPSSVLMLYQR